MRSKKINLAESIVAGLEATKQALEVFHGFEIKLLSDMQIQPSKIERIKLKQGPVEYRILSLTGRFCGRLAPHAESRRLYAQVDLKNEGQGWLAYRAHLGLGNLEAKRHSWCHADWGFNGKDPEEVRIIVEMGEGKENTNFRVGRGIADRHTEPLYPDRTSS